MNLFLSNLMNSQMLKFFNLGGPVMYLMLITSISATAIIIDRAIVFIRHRQNFDAVVYKLYNLIVEEKNWEAAEFWCDSQYERPFTRVAGVYMRHRNQSKDVREDLLKREGLEVLSHFDAGLRYLAMIAQIATLLGLLGTFHVMIMRLGQGQAAGNAAANFTSAVWEALLTTMYGLLIAIPCSAIYQVMEGKVDKISRQIEILVSYMDEWQRKIASTVD